MPFENIDWTTAITALATGTGGGIIGVWLNNRTAERVSQRQAAETVRLEVQAKEVALLAAKTNLREAVDSAAEAQLKRHGLEFERLANRLDTEITAREAVTARNEQLVAEMRSLYAELTGVQEQLAATKTALALAEAEVERKETVLVKLQRQVAELEELVTRLQAQLAKCQESSEE